MKLENTGYLTNILIIKICIKTMAKKTNKKAEELKEISRKEINGIIVITYEDGSVKIIPAPIILTKEQAEEIFGSDEDDDSDDDSDEDEDEDDSDEDSEEDDDDDDEEDDEDSDDEDDEDDEDEDEDDDEDEEDELTPEALAEMDFEELEDVCDDKDLDTDPDDFDEEEVEKLRKAVAKELGITLPKKSKKGKK